MPTKINIGLTKKAGLPGYGSIGASCHLELELDSRILDDDAERFRWHVQRAYAACRQAVEDELSREQPAALAAQSNRKSPPSMPHEHRRHNGNSHSKGNGNARRATQNQVRAVKAIAARVRADLHPFLARFEAQRVEDLSIADASSLIDALKDQQTQGVGDR
ncbi:MAG: hypothetical protein R3C05_09435 [Pirellulaceae bacterium]